MFFQSLESKIINSMTLQVFHDLYEPYSLAESGLCNQLANYEGMNGA